MGIYKLKWLGSQQQGPASRRVPSHGFLSDRDQSTWEKFGTWRRHPQTPGRPPRCSRVGLWRPWLPRTLFWIKASSLRATGRLPFTFRFMVFLFPLFFKFAVFVLLHTVWGGEVVNWNAGISPRLEIKRYTWVPRRNGYWFHFNCQGCSLTSNTLCSLPPQAENSIF